jgi:excinuclease UvrABC nuclease subunit
MTLVEIKDVSGVYCIRNRVNDKVYVGSAINIKKRLRKHLTGL